MGNVKRTPHKYEPPHVVVDVPEHLPPKARAGANGNPREIELIQTAATATANVTYYR